MTQGLGEEVPFVTTFLGSRLKAHEFAFFIGDSTLEKGEIMGIRINRLYER
jgi:hypothetical protein